MVAFPLLAVSFIMKLVAVVWFICALALILVVLIQKGRGGGLSGAFGGGLASGILGSKTGDFLTWVTIALAGVFILLSVILAKFYKPAISDFGTDAPQQTAVPQQRPPQPPIEPIGAEESGESVDINLPVE
jgi:preprotein translocase subunit SecG